LAYTTSDRLCAVFSIIFGRVGHIASEAAIVELVNA